MGTEADIVESAKYFKAAAEAGNELALCSFGRYLIYGHGVERNEEAGVTLLKMAVSAGSIYALVLLGDCFVFGLGVEKDLDRGCHLLRKAAEKIDLSALVSSGIFLKKNEMNDLMSLRKTTTRFSPKACHTLARFYRYGILVEKNNRKELETYERAVTGGHWPANLDIGIMYAQGKGVAKNIKKAILHFEIHAKYGNVRSHLHLAHLFRSEEGYFNENRAIHHFRFAADLGNMEASQVLGDYFVRSSGPQKLSFTDDELQAFVRNLQALFFGRNNNTRNILDLSGPYEENLEWTLNDPGNHQISLSSSKPRVTEYPYPTSSESAKGFLSSFHECISQKYPYWWVFILSWSLFSNLFLVVFISYSLYR